MLRLTLVLTVLMLGSGILSWHLHKANRQLEVQLKNLQTQLHTCQDNHSSLLSQVELDRKTYQEKLKELLKEARKPAKVITIPKVIERPIYISDEDCKKMGVMIDEAISELGK